MVCLFARAVESFLVHVFGLEQKGSKLEVDNQTHIDYSIIIVGVNGFFNMLGCSSGHYTIHPFQFSRFGKTLPYFFCKTNESFTIIKGRMENELFR
jgi:hypothetical protein